MFGVYVTHPQVLIDPAIPVPKWGLSEIGRVRAEHTASSPWIGRIRRIISSDETKAIETAEILASAMGLDVEIAEYMGENDRSATGFLPPLQFEKAADWFFAHPDESFHGWERAVDAQARIVSAFKRALEDWPTDRPIAFVGHGGVGTLLKCRLGNLPISRSQDQKGGGGGNLFAFRLDDHTLLSDWTPMEDWTGP
ncbi:histidine phosphatase family protein [Rhizobium sp. TRM95796]|uniref:histidine phosphatase family protein n=1 Tax=Rhizobium sp. TRM95796 TaxID=2979862 RepID=UPI0021E88BAB|nr:histidine phosphatase family protein [Rhizobium sp. TRM95796]MCV3768408.1 phosphoglycerate mutase family protein [Rhizobium sp. TRM95796]